MAAALGPLPLGGTPDGKAWCRKALHPADHEISSARYPGGSKVPTVASTYTQVAELVPDPRMNGHITSWDAHLYMRQDPVLPVGIRITTRLDNGQSGEIKFPWINRTVSSIPLFPGTTYGKVTTKDLNAAFATFLKGKNFYRITHMGLTVEHICSSTTNQGTIMSAQYATEPVVRPLAGYPDAVSVRSVDNDNLYRVFGKYDPDVGGDYPLAPAAGKVFSLYQGMNTRHYLEGTPTSDMLLQATNGYTGPAKDGLYIPLKLDSPERFVNVDKKYVLLGKDDNVDPWGPWATRSGTFGSQMGWPYYAEYTGLNGDGSAPVLAVGCKECGSTVSDTLIKGLDPHASLRLYLRVGVEYVPEIDTDTACFARMSPLPDDLAVRMYQELTCRLKDAYPMDYNDKSRLLEVINQYAKKLVPAIDKGLNFFADIPGNPWSGVARGLRTLTSAYIAPPARPRRKQRQKGGGAKSSSSSLVKTGSTVTVDLGGGQKGKAKVLEVIRPNKKKK